MRLRDKQARLDADTPLAARLACPPAVVAAAIAKLQSLPGVLLTADCAMGTINVTAHEPGADFVNRVTNAASADANLQWMRLDTASEIGAALQSVKVWGDTRESAALQRALKKSLDPKGTFSPGRFVGKI